MNIRKLVTATATAVAGGLVLAASGVAFGDEVGTGTSVAPGSRVCVELPSTDDPVRAEGLADRDVSFTLTSNGVVLAQSGPTDIFWMDANSSANPGAFPGVPGVVQLCADNGSEEEAFVTLSLVSSEQEDAVVSANVAAEPAAADEPVIVADEPAEISLLSTDGARSVIELIDELIEELIEEILEDVSAIVD